MALNLTRRTRRWRCSPRRPRDALCPSIRRLSWGQGRGRTCPEAPAPCRWWPLSECPLLTRVQGAENTRKGVKLRLCKNLLTAEARLRELRKDKWILRLTHNIRGFPGDRVAKNPPANAGNARDVGLIPGLGGSPGEGKGNPLHYFCLENFMDRGAWWTTVHGAMKSQTQLSMHTHITHTHIQHYLCASKLQTLLWSRFSVQDWIPPVMCTSTCVIAQTSLLPLQPFSNLSCPLVLENTANESFFL